MPEGVTSTAGTRGQEFAYGQALSLGSGGVVVVGKLLAKGGQGVIYESLLDPDIVVKRINPAALARDRELERKLWVMVGSRPPGWRSRGGHVVLTWPLDLVFAMGKFVGFTMPRVDTKNAAELHVVANPSDRGRPGPQTPGWVQDFTWRYLLQTAVNLARATDALHQADVVFGDFNERNMLVSQRALVTFVDCDSMQIPDPAGAGFLCGVGRPEFTAPEVFRIDVTKTPRAPSSDRFPLAVHIHQLLLEGAYPFDGIWHGAGEKPGRSRLAAKGIYAYAGDRLLTPPPGSIPYDLVPPDVRELFRRAFVTGAIDPELRPSAGEWRRVLIDVAGSLKSCSKVQHHVYPGNHKRCPWCQHQSSRTAAGHASRPNGHATAPRDQVRATAGPQQAGATNTAPPQGAAAGGGPAHTPRVASGTNARIQTPSGHAGATPRPAPRPAPSHCEIHSEIRTLFTVHVLLPLAASLLGTIWAATSLQTSSGSHPYGKALMFLLNVSAWTGIPALLASMIFDLFVWMSRSPRFALTKAPRWHRNLLVGAAIVPPLTYFIMHWGEKFSQASGNEYGPPRLFWWLAPIGMLGAHVVCLCVRGVTESGLLRQAAHGRAPSSANKRRRRAVAIGAAVVIAGTVVALVKLGAVSGGSRGTLGSAPSAGADSTGNEYVLWRGNDGHLWESLIQGSVQSAATRIGQAGVLGSAPSVAVHASGEQDVFWKGTNGQLWETWYTGSWHRSIPLSAGTLGSAPAAGVDSAGNQYVFWRGTDGGLWETWFKDGHWHRAIRIGQAGILGSAPSVAVHANGEQDVFWKGTNGQLWETWYTGSWHSSIPLSAGTLGSAPAAGVDSAGNQYVFWRGTDRGLWETWFKGGRWHRAIRIGQVGMLASAPTVVVYPNGNQDVLWDAASGGLGSWQLSLPRPAA